MIIQEKDYLQHYGTPRHSGRYPWGSGGDDEHYVPRNSSFLDAVEKLHREGLTESQIAKGMLGEDGSVTELRAIKTIEKNANKASEIAFAQRLKDKGVSNVQIGVRMGKGESYVRGLLAPGAADKSKQMDTITNMLRDQIKEKGETGIAAIDVGEGVENHLGISQEKLRTACYVLKQEGYTMYYPKIPQVGTGKETTRKVLAAPGVTGKEIWDNRFDIGNLNQIDKFSEDRGRTLLGIHPPLSLSSKRVAVRYAEEGGSTEDGVLWVRPGVDDLSLGNSRYAQVRVMVDGSHYLKGMAIYKEGLPPGVDVVFNTNKSNTGNKLDAMKPLKQDKDGVIDPDNPFGSNIKVNGQIVQRNAKGDEVVTSVMNKVHEEGDWDQWSRSLSAQTLSKQNPKLAEQQLNVTYESRKAELDEILTLTNPAVRRKLLDSFAEDADAAAVHLKAAAIPRSSWHVILPVNSMKENEIYAPNFRNGESVALIRYPHGGTFEIPVLKVNNKNPVAKDIIGERAKDAVGIHSEVAKRLSGADFDGDTVLVIPNNTGAIKTTSPLQGLKDFDPQASFPPYHGMKTIDGGTWNEVTKKVEYGPKGPTTRKQNEMGNITNLIADMTIKGAGPDDIARAVRHSMVVIDSEKHVLNFKESAKVNNIPQLKAKYQGRNENGQLKGASTLITRKKSDVRVPDDRRLIDPTTGRLVSQPGTAKTWVNRDGAIVTRQRRSTKLAETDDARTLISDSNTLIERIYADHSNKLKSLANDARRESVNTKPTVWNHAAKEVYKDEIATLDAKLNLAKQNAPLERQAQALANRTAALKKAANPQMDKDTEKKIRNQALVEMRARIGAVKDRIDLTDREWEAIQAGAISNNKLTEILRHTDIDKVRARATPKQQILMTSSKVARAQTMASQGYTQAEIASQLGVSLTTLKNSIGGE